MPEDEQLEQAKADNTDSPDVYAERLKKHVKRHMNAGHPAHIAVALAQQSIAQEDEAPGEPEVEPDADDKALGEKRNIPQSERDKLPPKAFAGPNQSFPIAKPEDIAAAAHLIGKADNPDAVKARIIAIAKKRGWTAQLPADWMPAKKSFNERLTEGLKAFGLLKDDADEMTGLKIAGNNWLMFWSNNFKDRDGEIFPEKAIDAYVARVDNRMIPPPDAAVWHLGQKTYIGKAEWVARHGHFLVAAGAFSEDAAAQKARSYYATHTKDTGISHGFTFPKSAFDGKQYNSFNSFEISLLPRGAEANWYTSLEGVKSMALDERKVKYLKEVFGEEHATRILADWDARGKALEEIGVEFKDFTDPNADTGKANKEAVELASKSLVELFPELVEGQAETVSFLNTMAKEFTKVRAENAEFRKEIEAIRDTLALAPRSAATDPATALDVNSPAGKALMEKVNKQLVEVDSFTGLQVVKS